MIFFMCYRFFSFFFRFACFLKVLLILIFFGLFLSDDFKCLFLVEIFFLVVLLVFFKL